MAKYLYIRIEDGALKYEDVINKFPQYKKEIDVLMAA